MVYEIGFILCEIRLATLVYSQNQEERISSPCRKLYTLAGAYLLRSFQYYLYIMMQNRIIYIQYYVSLALISQVISKNKIIIDFE